MEFVVYIIYSANVNRYYIGHCQNLAERMSRHNGGRSKYTKMAKDWKVMWTKDCCSRADAMGLEREIKKKKSRKYIEFLITSEKLD